ncbi:MAG TPA: T9SS type A sorting domain-containing protein [Candidatus Marinimicrobia bacterium]|mgnify:CR=1 FL=1|nr:T9SS type A sorting domain-containing protein [Candidatus Neomarinimicrobiota bacterium]
MMRRNISGLFFLLLLRIGLAQIQPEELLFIPWNIDSLGNVSYTFDPEGRVGPQNFQVDGDNVYLLDQHQRVIHHYVAGQLADRLPVTRAARDFVIPSGGDYACLADNGINIYKNRKMTESIRQTGPLPIIQKIKQIQNEIIAVNHDGSVSKIANQRLSKATSPGMPTYDLKKESRSRATVTLFDESGNRTGTINLDIPGNNLGSFGLVGVDKYDRLFLNLDLIIQEIPLKVQREVWIVKSSGEHVGKITIPPHCYAKMWNDLRLDEKGILYHMLSSNDGIHIFKWDLSRVSATSFEGIYPEKYQRYRHYNEVIPAEPESPEKKSPLHKPNSTVTRSEALAIADTYVMHGWAATAANITNGLITDPNGVELWTPEWVQPGTNYKIPYKWGGFNTIPQFDQGLSDGKSAGDRATSGVSSYAVGVDCSGFVSRCWKLTSHYSTRSMDVDVSWDNIDGPITTLLDSWDNIKPGDAIHKHGHVILAVSNMGDGSILAVEAAGSKTDWRVNYTNRPYSEIVDYSPREYINMIGPGIVIAQPVLLTTLDNDTQVSFSWNLDSEENISGIRLEYSEDGESWNSLLGDSLIAADITSIDYEWSDGPVFIRAKSINNEEDEEIESLPSDTYGFYTTPGDNGKVLIVDGFDRRGSWNLPYHHFARWMGADLASLGVSFETVANEALTAGAVQLSDYRAVYWILGDESTEDETFSTAEQALVADYLENGGQLFVSGSEIAWDLDNKGSSTDKAFFLNYLRAGYVQDDADDHSVSGSAGGIFTGLAFDFDNGNDGIYEEDYPDVIMPKLDAVTCLEYSAGKAAAIQYEGVFSNGSAPGKLVYFGFPWETITSPLTRKAVLKNISEWFGFDCLNIDRDNLPVPARAKLSHGYPNPFNSRVTFKLMVPGKNAFEGYIYNSRGQIVRKINHYGNKQNEYFLTWDGCNAYGQTVASGCYLLQVVCGDQVLTEKIILLK